MRRNSLLTITFGLIIGLLFGCSHTLTVQNLPDTKPTALGSNGELTVGIMDEGDARFSDEYTEAIVRALQTQPSVERVIYPYANSRKDEVDVVAQVDVDPEYTGSVANFFINWPGFMIFTPAWHGYVYHANPRTSVLLSTPAGEKLGKVDWEYNYKFHQADIGRTWTNGVGWMEYGVTPLIGGLVFIQYDTDQTQDFLFRVRENYGRQVAQEINQFFSTR